VKSPEDWAKRRAEIVRGMESVMGKLPGDKKRCPLDLKTESEEECGKFVRRLVTYASEPDCRVPAYLLIPKDVLKGKKKVPAILCLHGTDNEVGNGTVVGLGSGPNRAYASELARAMSVASKDIFAIEDAALLHDVGKICVPDVLLSKPGPLTVEEAGIVAAHPVIGAGMFARTIHLRELAPIVRHHHERFDGQGYPDRLAGEAIPLGARIVAVCDIFDALVSHRVYRPAMDFAAARNKMAEWSGSRRDPALVSAFLDLALEKMTEH